MLFPRGDFMQSRDNISTSLGRIERKPNDLAKEFEGVKKAIFGNGQPGHAQCISALEANENRWFGKSSVISWIIAALLSIAIALLGKVMK